MRNELDKILAIIPLNHNWLEYGSWKDTLHTELALLPSETRHMCLKSTSTVFFRKFPFLFGIHMHGHSGEWCPLEAIPGYEYCFQSTDGRSLDELNIQGPFDKEILLHISEEFEKAGLEFKDRWSLLIAFTE